MYLNMDSESKYFVKIRGKTASSVISNVVSLGGRNVMQIKIGTEENKSIPIDQVITLDHLTNPDKK